MAPGVSITINNFSDYPKIQARDNKPQEILKEKSKYLRAWQILTATISAVAGAVFVGLAVLAFIALSQVAVASIFALPAFVPLAVGIIALISTVALATLAVVKSISAHQNRQPKQLPKLQVAPHREREHFAMRDPVVVAAPPIAKPGPENLAPVPEIHLPQVQAPLQPRRYIGKYGFLAMDQNKTKDGTYKCNIKAGHPIPFNDLSAGPSDIEIKNGICLLRRPGTYSINFGFMTWKPKAEFELQQEVDEGNFESIPGSRLSSVGQPNNLERMCSLTLLFVAERPNVRLRLQNCSGEKDGKAFDVELGHYATAGSVIASILIEKKD